MTEKTLQERQVEALERIADTMDEVQMELMSINLNMKDADGSTLASLLSWMTGNARSGGGFLRVIDLDRGNE